ncbi:1,2-dihydroxy-3-keto-5-methylthiopentene dioxygenase [Gonapodya sp. JEL0774]|nr:1,2-dihydroxy-3-keto-5-methylthiopentene dioxygenase [Gonapodya sp. JEL0774]
MVSAWEFNESDGIHPNAAHQFNPNKEVPISVVEALGVEFKSIPIAEDGSHADAAEQWVKQNRAGYEKRTKEVTSRAALGEKFESKLQNGYGEHFHSADEIRFNTAGAGFFDVRDASDKWIRVTWGPGELISVPEGLWHRFTVDEGEFAEELRWWPTQKAWKRFDRTDPTSESTPSRQEYLQKYSKAG